MKLSLVLPEALISATRNGDIVPLLGSGLSQASGMASWVEIVDVLRTSLTSPGEHVVDLDILETPDAFASRGRERLVEVLRQAVERGFSPNILHGLLAEIPFGTCLTANWDTLIERALTPTRRVNIVFDDDTATTWRESQGIQVVKMHGTIDHPRSIVFGLKDYAQFYQKPSLLMSLVRTLVSTRAVLAIGFGMRDPFLKALFHSVSNNRTREDYVVVPEGALDKVRRRYLEDIGFTVIDAPVSIEDAHGLHAFLTELRSQTYIEATSRVDRTRLLIRETDRLALFLGRDRTLRIRAHLGPLAVPPTNEFNVFGEEDVYNAEIALLESVRAFLRRRGTCVRLICCPFAGTTSASQRGYSTDAHRARLVAFRGWVAELGDQVQLAFTERPSDVNDWIAADVALVESRKSVTHDGRLYDYAKLELNPTAVAGAVRRFDEEFNVLAERAGGVSTARTAFLDRTLVA